MTAKLNIVQKARKDQGNCRKCGHPIKAGDSYLWFSLMHGGRNGPKQCYHNLPACRPTDAERETNDKRRSYAEAEEHLSYARDQNGHVEIAESLRLAMDSVQDIANSLDETLSAWSGTNFENSERYQTFENTKDELESWLDAAETVASELEALNSPDDPTTYEEPDPLDYATEEDATGEESEDYQRDKADYDKRQEEFDEYEEAIDRLIGEIDDLPALEL